MKSFSLKNNRYFFKNVKRFQKNIGRFQKNTQVFPEKITVVLNWKNEMCIKVKLKQR